MSIAFGMLAAVGLLAGIPTGPLSGQGHGPAYGLSTPTLGRDAWSVDVSAMARWGTEGENAGMLRPMVSYGITEDLQLSLSWPVPLVRTGRLRPVRGWTRMPAGRDVEALLGWRFHREATGVGSRFESTTYVGLDVPTDDVRGGVETAPAYYGALVSGYASRSVYAWAGAAYRGQRWIRAGEDRPGDVIMYSFVFGYRPEIFRRDLPHPDWRLFLEAVGEYSAPGHSAGQEQPRTPNHEIFIAPTVLGLFGAWGVSGGPAFPLYRTGGSAPADRLRLVVNTTLWF